MPEADLDQPPRRTPAGDELTALVLRVFRLNGRFLEAADIIAAPAGLTSARWQVLGAVLDQPRSVAEIARRMGLARQSVQRVADCLVDDGMATYLPNPRHQRAKLLAPSARGWQAIEVLRPRQWAWADNVAAVIGWEQLRSVNAVLDTLLIELNGDYAPHASSANQRQA